MIITINWHWHYIFPVLATIWYFSACKESSTQGNYMDLLGYAFLLVPYTMFWLFYLLVLHW